MNDIKDVTLTAAEQRVIRMALLQFIIEESKAAKTLEKVQCPQMAKAIQADVDTASTVLKLI